MSLMAKHNITIKQESSKMTDTLFISRTKKFYDSKYIMTRKEYIDMAKDAMAVSLQLFDDNLLASDICFEKGRMVDSLFCYYFEGINNGSCFNPVWGGRYSDAMCGMCPLGSDIGCCDGLLYKSNKGKKTRDDIRKDIYRYIKNINIEKMADELVAKKILIKRRGIVKTISRAISVWIEDKVRECVCCFS